MPFSLIPTTLGVAFFVMWALIGLMLLRDGRQAAYEEREFNDQVLPLSPHRAKKRGRRSMARMAS